VYCLKPRDVKIKKGVKEEEQKKAREEEAREWSEVELKLRRILLF
jgi:hypothetical protein